ncbi:MFS transporter [Actinocrispum wychmicini]|uniref:Putative MFS family arabinose efflux permease n=1 Tax=Actinocrispum wychmicini TaxID=1213861 RepID=A0A4R2JLE0_9PSEU|nr:MFS transporter [Actinocrispum wychmicini]TCO60851.1 putative MFS family arabinose efflux permease [Actinocrispum wychmicini]
MSRPRGLIRRHRDFRWFWSGQAVSVMGTQVTAVALPLVATLLLDARAGAVGAIAAATYLPNVVVPMLAGHWLETRRRRPALIGADVVRALALAVVPLSVLLGFLSLPLLVVVAFVVGAASVVFDVGSFAYVPGMVDDDDLPRANQALEGSLTVAQVAGPGFAGVLVQWLGPAVAVLVDSASYIASLVGITAARRPEPEPVVDSTERRKVLAGLRHLLGNPVLRALTIHAGVYNVGSQILMVNLLVWLVSDRQVSVGVYGLGLSAAGAGAFVGTMSVLRVSGRIGYGWTYVLALLLFTGVPLVLAALPMSGTALGVAVSAVWVVAGVGLGGANVLSTTLRQAAVPKAALARSIGTYRFLIFGVIPLGSAAAGVIGETFGSRTGVAVGTVVMALSAVPMVRREVRGLHDPQDAVTTAD